MPLNAAPARTAVPAPALDNETMRFARAVLDRPYLFTIVFLIANFFVFLLMWHASGMSTNALWVFPGPVLIRYGAKLNLLINQQPHQWWRFVTPMFLHGSLLHLLVNMYSLWMIGPYVEKLYGSARFVFFWVVTGIAGVVASYLTVVGPSTNVGSLGRFVLKAHDDPSVGASGALFGLVGVLFVFGIKFRNELPEGFKRAFGTGLLPVIMINLFIGFMGRGFIDNAAHLGGLASGAALALVVGYRRPGESSSMSLVWKILQAASLALVLFSFARVVQHAGEPTPFDGATEEQVVAPSVKAQDFLTFVKAINGAQDALVKSAEGDASGLDAANATLEQVNAPDVKSDQLKRKLQALLLRAKVTDSTPSQKTQLQTDLGAWDQEYENWLKTANKTSKDEPQ